MNETSPVHRAIRMLGGPVRAAQRLGVERYQTVQHWARKGLVPAEYCPLIEQATDGLVRCEELRPSVNWGLVRGTATAENQEAA